MSSLQSTWNKSMVNKMVMLMVVAFLASFILKNWLPGGDFVYSLFLFNPEPNAWIKKPWSIFTYIFLHADFFHLLFNMLWLYFIGMILEDLIGPKHIIKLIIYGGLSGGLFFMLLYNLFPVMQHPGGVSLVGASGGVTALIVATAVFSPNYTILLFGVFPVQLKWIAIVRVLIDVVSISPSNANLGGTLTHLGGAAFGLLYMLHTKGNIRIPLVDLLQFSLRKSNRKPARKARVEIERNFSSNKNTRNRKPNQDEIDAILDKINKSGYDSLSKEEKELLFRAGE